MSKEKDKEVEAISEEYKFSAYGWVREPDCPITLDKPLAILKYLTREATQKKESKVANIQKLAEGLLCEVDRFLAADAERADLPETGYRKALVAMYMLGTQAAKLEEELAISSDQKIKWLKGDIGQMSRYSSLLEANKDKTVGRQTARTIVMAYAREKWAEDANKEIRIGEMTRMIWKWMAEHIQLVEYRPETEKHLREWLKPIAAHYPHSQKRGRKTRS